MSIEAPEQVRPDLVPDTTLRELEEETEEQLWAIILPAAAAQGATGATLRQVVERVVELVRSATGRAMTLGAALGHALAPTAVLAARRTPAPGRVGSGILGVPGGLGRPGAGSVRPRATLPTLGQVAAEVARLGIDDQVRAWMGRAATALDGLSTAPVEQRMQRLEQIVRGLWGHTVTRIHRLVNRGSEWFASTFEFALSWHTRQDERTCPSCRPMHGRRLGVVGAGGFAAPVGEGIPTVWEGFSGLPPLHPRCRCFVRPTAR